MVAGAVASSAAKAAAGKSASGVSKAAGKSVAGASGSAAGKGNKFGIQTPSQEQQSSAGKFLNNSESSNQDDNNEDQNESSNEMNYTGGGQNSNRRPFGSSRQNQGQKKKLDLKKLKKASPLIIGLCIVLGPILLIFGTGSLLFADIDENTMAEMDVQYLAMRTAAQTAVKVMLQNGSLPSTFAETLTENGLEVGYLDTNGTFIAGLRPTSENSIALASSATGINPEVDNSLVIRFGETIIDADSWDYFAETNKEVYSKFKDATYGRAAGHYDNAASAFYSTINASRNVFSGYTSSSTDFKEILNDYYTNNSSTRYGVADSRECSKTDTCEPETNKTSTKTQSQAIDEYLDILYKNTLIDYDDCSWDGNSLISGLICDAETKLHITDDDNKIYDDVQAAVIAYLVNTAVNANETYESMKYFLTLEEVMSKTKAGEGSGAPINEMLNYLTTEDENGISAVQSDTLSSILTKSFTDYTGQDAKNYSIDRTQNIATEFDYENDGFKDTINSIGLAITGLTINSGSSSYGASDDSMTIIKTLKEPQKSEYGCKNNEETPSECSDYNNALSIYNNYKNDDSSHPKTKQMINKLRDYLNSKEITFLTDEGFNTISGSQSGETFSKGASILGSKIATFAEGGTTGTEETVATYQKETKELLAWEAEVERSEKSPFDITSQNTFLGSIVHSFSSYLYTSTNLSSFSNIIKNSFSSILPGVFADSESSFQTTYGNCPESSDDFVCSTFSYPQTTFDLSSIKNYLETTLNQEKQEPDSTYEQYEKYNNKRATSVGYINTSMADEIWNNKSDTEKVDGLVQQFNNFSTNKIFQFNITENRIKDYFSTYYERFKDEEMAIITGSQYTNSGGNAQAYCAYSRFLDQIGYFSDENTNTAQISSQFIPGTGQSKYIASLQNYAEEFRNLSDTEYLATISGISEDEANLVLGYIAYNSYLASIDYESAIAFGKKESFNLENSNQSETTIQIAIHNSEIKITNFATRRREVTNVA